MLNFNRKLRMLAPALLLSAFGATSALADPLSTPAMAGPIAANPDPFSFDTSDWLGDAGGPIYVTGAATAMTYYQSNPVHTGSGDAESAFDLPNAMVAIQKTDGWLQFFALAGNYSFPTVGVPYTKSSLNTPGSFGVVPLAYVTLQGQGALENFSLQAGKLPTLIGNEYAFTFQNMNIERGLLWNIEPLFSRGVQVNYADGPLTISLSWNDGMYSNNLNWMSGLISYAVSPTDTLVFSGGANLGGHNGGLLNQGGDYTLIWSHSDGPLTISPYVQLNTTPKVTFAGTTIFDSEETWSGAILAKLALNDNWSIAARAEYLASGGDPAVLTTPDILGYGPGSSAWTFTVTPTFQYKSFFARLEGSYVGLTDAAPGSAFGSALTNTDQVRVMFEAGVVF